MFGSVPLRTYLPDGDIDISVFAAPDPPPGPGAGPPLRETWAMQLLRALEREQAAPARALRVRDSQLIQAEVRLVKCVVADLVVDVSFNTLGGLCTVAILEAVDRHLGQGHIFKRSVVLVGGAVGGGQAPAPWPGRTGRLGAAAAAALGRPAPRADAPPPSPRCPRRSRRGATTRAGCWARTTA